jgi:hypothetical protein
VGAWISVECPVEGCSYGATFRLGADAETKGAGEQRRLLRDEHPNHPPDEEDERVESGSESN